METMLVTGGAGFIGSCFVKACVREGKYHIINLDALTYAGSLDNLEEVSNDENHLFVHGDIRDRAVVEGIFEAHEIKYVVNFAAESHVDRSIENPQIFLDTNIKGTQNLMDVALKYWKMDPQDNYSRDYKEGVKFIQISTDEVYGELGEAGFFVETTPLAPNSPYSASKAGADLLVQAYHHTYGLPINITRCSNNYGPHQFTEKLIPLMITKALSDQALPVYGDGLQVRDWLHVSDHCEAILSVIESGISGEVYNIGGNNEWSNIETVRLILAHLGKSESLISYVADRPGHDRRYAIDNTKIKRDLGWQPKYAFEEGLRETVQWYVKRARM